DLQGARRLVVRRQLAVLVEMQPQQLTGPASRRDGDFPGEVGDLDDAAALEGEQLAQRVGKVHAARGGADIDDPALVPQPEDALRARRAAYRLGVELPLQAGDEHGSS